MLPHFRCITTHALLEKDILTHGPGDTFIILSPATCAHERSRGGIHRQRVSRGHPPERLPDGLPGVFTAGLRGPGTVAHLRVRLHALAERTAHRCGIRAIRAVQSFRGDHRDEVPLPDAAR